MHTAVKRILKGGLFVLIPAAVIFLLSGILSPRYNYRDCGRMAYRFAGVYGEPENSIDLILAGDSESFASYSPMQLWKEHGITSYQCSSPMQTVQKTYEYLETILENQSPSVLVIDAYHLFTEETWEQVIHSGIRMAVPAIENHDLWRKMSLHEVKNPGQGRYLDDLKGFSLTFDAKPSGSETMSSKNQYPPLPAVNYFVFSRLVELCREHDIQILLVSSPRGFNWSYGMHDRIVELSDKYKIPYLDMNLIQEKIGIDWEKHTWDNGDHLNYAGAVLTTRYLGQWLLQQTKLPDHREDPSFASWEESLKTYENAISKGENWQEISLRPAEQ